MEKIVQRSVNSAVVSADELNYINAATSDNTRKAYQADIDHFLNFGFGLPTTPEFLTDYLKKSAEVLNPRTILRRLTSIKNGTS